MVLDLNNNKEAAAGEMRERKGRRESREIPEREVFERAEPRVSPKNPPNPTIRPNQNDTLQCDSFHRVSRGRCPNFDLRYLLNALSHLSWAMGGSVPSVTLPTTSASSMKLGAQKASEPVKKVSAVKPTVIIMNVLFVTRYFRSSAYADNVAVF